MPGPERTSEKVRDLNGTFRADRPELPPGVEFDRVESLPKAPQHLNVDGQNMWRDLGGILVRTGVLQVTDLYAFEQLCYCWQQHRARAKAGLPITPGQDAILNRMFAEFGVTPSARRRVMRNLGADGAGGMTPPAGAPGDSKIKNPFAEHAARRTS